MKAYIDLKTDKRKDPKIEFEQNFLKLMNNSVLGKTMENMTNYMEIALTTDPNKAINHLSKPNFKNARYIDDVYMVEFYNDNI